MDTFKIGDKVKSTSPVDDKRWVGVVDEVGVGQVKLHRVSDKNKKNSFWVRTDTLVIKNKYRLL